MPLWSKTTTIKWPVVSRGSPRTIFLTAPKGARRSVELAGLRQFLDDRHVPGLCAKTLNEMWSFNVGSPIQAPPVTYAVNGKQYVAVLVGARMWPYIIQNAPELKNQATASMLYVFSL